MDFLARAQVAAAARMAEEYAESKMIQCALMGELEPQEDRALQKIDLERSKLKTPLFSWRYLSSTPP